MAHEINNPLAGMLQNAQVVLRRTLTDLPANREAAEQCGTTLETIRTYMTLRDIPNMLASIRTSGRRAAKTVQDMLSFSQPSRTETQPEDLAKLLNEAVELAAKDYDLRKEYDFRKIEILREYDTDLPEVPCQALEIEQVVLNLLRNAAQAMAGQEGRAEGSRIILRAMRDADTGADFVSAVDGVQTASLPKDVALEARVVGPVMRSTIPDAITFYLDLTDEAFAVFTANQTAEPNPCL